MQTRQVKREAAEARQAISDKMSPTERLAHLDTVFGFNMGATRERARLQKKLGGAGDVMFTEPSEPGKPAKIVKKKRK